MNRHPENVDGLSTLKSKLLKSVLKHFDIFKDPILIPGGYEEAITLIYVPSEELVADVLTKATIGAKFKYLRAKLLGQDE